MNSDRGKITVIMRGGFGNQLFSFALGYHLSKIHNLSLIIDDVTSFNRDKKYNRKCHFKKLLFPCELVSDQKHLWWLDLVKYRWYMLISRLRISKKHTYLLQGNTPYDETLLLKELTKSTFLDGYWQSYKYFDEVESDIKNIISKALLNIPDIPLPKLKSETKVALHLRFFDQHDPSTANDLSLDYYTNAISYFKKIFGSPTFLVFSTDIQRAQLYLRDVSADFHFVSADSGITELVEFKSMWSCDHFITANSTYSWWAAWASTSPDKIVVTPSLVIKEGPGRWGFEKLIPNNWVKI